MIIVKPTFNPYHCQTPLWRLIQLDQARKAGEPIGARAIQRTLREALEAHTIQTHGRRA